VIPKSIQSNRLMRGESDGGGGVVQPSLKVVGGEGDQFKREKFATPLSASSK
jgi:hypothetical protein